MLQIQQSTHSPIALSSYSYIFWNIFKELTTCTYWTKTYLTDLNDMNHEIVVLWSELRDTNVIYLTDNQKRWFICSISGQWGAGSCNVCPIRSFDNTCIVWSMLSWTRVIAGPIHIPPSWVWMSAQKRWNRCQGVVVISTHGPILITENNNVCFYFFILYLYQATWSSFELG